jgi:hypothetical protein
MGQLQGEPVGEELCFIQAIRGRIISTGTLLQNYPNFQV